MSLVGVKRETLDKYGVVSGETAAEMAEGGLCAADADMALSVTGIAGPGGGTAKKPVGLCYIGCAYKSENGMPEKYIKTVTEKHIFQGNRMQVREQAAAAAVALALKCLEAD